MKTRLLLFCLLAGLGVMTSLQAQEEEVFRVAEEMPEYPGCEAEERGAARLRCSRVKLTDYLKANLVYPAEAKAQGVVGTAVVSFIVNKDGSLSDIKVLRDIGAGCGEAAKAVIHKMVADGIRWNPGRQRGVPVRVLFNLPVVFKLPVKGFTQEVIEEERMMEEDAIEEEMVIQDQEIAVEAPPPMLERAEPGLSKASPPPSGEEIFRVVEEMPRLFQADCEMMSELEETKSCALSALLNLLYSNLKYPPIALENGVEGNCVVQFNVLEDGSLDDIKLVRDIGAGCGQEALRLIRLSTENGSRWLPGKQRGVPVKVQYVIPVKFELPYEERSSNETQVDNSVVFIPEDAFNMEDEIKMEGPRPQVEEEPMNRRPVREEPLAPPPPPPPPQVTKEVFYVVEEMPRFLDDSCEALASSERKSCAEDKMFEYIYQELEYPEIAEQSSLEGTVVVAFVVEKDGRITDIRVLRDIGGGCGQEAARIVRTMNDDGINWTPGKQRGRAVRVEFNLPIKFRLD